MSSNTPQSVKITQIHRDSDNNKERDSFNYSNNTNIDAATLMSTLSALIGDKVVPAQFGMDSAAPCVHPAGVLTDEDDVYVEIYEDCIELLDAPSKQPDGDISEIVSNINFVKEHGELESYKQMGQELHRDTIEQAQTALDSLNMTTIHKDELAALRDAADASSALDFELLKEATTLALSDPSTRARLEQQGFSETRLKARAGLFEANAEKAEA